MVWFGFIASLARIFELTINRTGITDMQANLGMDNGFVIFMNMIYMECLFVYSFHDHFTKDHFIDKMNAYAMTCA